MRFSEPVTLVKYNYETHSKAHNIKQFINSSEHNGTYMILQYGLPVGVLIKKNT